MLVMCGASSLSVLFAICAVLGTVLVWVGTAGALDPSVQGHTVQTEEPSSRAVTSSAPGVKPPEVPGLAPAPSPAPVPSSGTGMDTGGGVGGSEQKVALVIGNAAYEAAPLRNPLHDARAMARVLSEVGFTVIERENLTQKDIRREVQAFGQQLLKGGVGLFYFAGHGMQVNGRNYLIPIGATIEHEKQVEYEGVDAGVVLGEMEHARNRLNIVILDACRDNPFARSFRSGVQGLASMNAPTGTLIAYATAPGSVANDGQGENSVYTGELVRSMLNPGLKIEDVFKQVRSAVRESTQGKQVPWESSSLEGDFYFKPLLAKSVPQVATERSAEQVAAPQVAASRGEGSGGAARSRPLKTWKEPSTGMEFVWIPGGCFLMGSPMSEKDREVDGFWMAKTEVTNGQFRKFLPTHDSRSYEGHSLNGDSQPVVYVSWDDATAFAQWLTAQNGGQYKFRLPTEAEWEYSSRAGTNSSRYWGDEPSMACDYENVADITAGRQWSWEEIHECDDGYAATAPVGRFQPNPFGLHDMLGNVWEWCEDVYSIDVHTKHERDNPVNRDSSTGPDRVIRGGFWHGGPHSVRCADRGSGLPTGANDDLGFRLVREQ